MAESSVVRTLAPKDIERGAEDGRAAVATSLEPQRSNAPANSMKHRRKVVRFERSRPLRRFMTIHLVVNTLNAERKTPTNPSAFS
jgi:hypothetical protein